MRYTRAIGRFADAALNLASDRLRSYLREHRETDFKSAESFADELLKTLESSFARGWRTRAAVTAIKRTVRSIYDFFRVRDATPFGGESPVKLKLGGPDLAALRFIEKLDHFYFSKFGPNTSKPLREFFIKEYLENGAALFGRETSDEVAAFRAAAGEKLKNLTDAQVKTIITSAVQRLRNWAHIGSLSQAEFELARIVAVLDQRTTEICRGLNGKLIRVAVAQKTIERLIQLEPGEFAKEMYESDIAKSITRDPADVIKKFLEDDGKTISDDLVETGRGFPPYHPNCRTRLAGVIEGINEDG